MHWILRILPKNYVSRLIGRLAGVCLPPPFSSWSIKLFVWLFRIDLSSAAKPVQAYPSIAEFFIRELKPESLPLPAATHGRFLAPVDGTWRAWGEVHSAMLMLVKGKQYSIPDLLGDPKSADLFEEGYFFNFYLAVADYHHVHSPADGFIVGCRHIPGRLWPVNDWSVENIAGLFSVNERLVTYIETAQGVLVVVMIGATNVGKMTAEFDDIRTNLPRAAGGLTAQVRKYTPPLPIRAGARLGTFNMGSSVVVLVSGSNVRLSRVSSDPLPQPLRYGEVLAEYLST